ncbi:hypothetical protein HHK36_025275 [Tetracentron sinense]|uniref:J domain-containing protein n=1 Tax=Tetracentron sinense TaxID=13715 RepID=A0A835D518_TETSI|nr:hypothetical protein HHK36_025275 [Tetracentron sinense]
MKHNKVGALLEKAIAEKMIVSNDYMGARDKLLKAQQLFPKLDNIDPMLTVCDILCSANISFPGYGIDCYWVLQVLPSANDSDIKSRYQKLVNLLEPIKNRFPGTELALKLIGEASSVLSDQEKRSAFDMKRGTTWVGCGSLNSKTSSHHEIANKEMAAPAQSSSGRIRVCTSQILDGDNGEVVLREMQGTRIKNLGPNLLAGSNIDKQQERIGTQEPNRVSADVNSEGNGGLDRSADSISSPTVMHSANLDGDTSWSSKIVAQIGPDPGFYDFENNRKHEVFEVGQIWATQHRPNKPHSLRYAHINIKSESALDITWLKPVPVTADERRWCDAGLPVACGSFDLDPEMSENVSWPMFFSHMCSWVHGVTEEQFEIYPKKGEIWAMYKDWDISEWSNNPETVKACKFEIIEILTDYSKYLGATGTCLVKVDGFRSVFHRPKNKGNQLTLHITPNKLYMLSHNVPAFQFVSGEMDGVIDGIFELDPLALPDDMDPSTVPKEGNSSSCSGLPPPPRCLAPMDPFPENQSLKPNWSRNDFAVGQIWAIYSGADFMPRRYARINNVVSVNQVCVTSLEPQPTLDHEKNWQKENLPIVSGIFRVGNTSRNLEMSSFSHLVKCQRSKTISFYRIYPMKGEIWAMYKNWNNKWKQSDYDGHQCQIVQILSDFSEGNRMTIAKLVEVKGCMTFFQRQRYNAFDLTRAVSKTELYCLSHRIPAFSVPGCQRYGIPEGSWHLDPDALPLKLGN